MNELPENLPPGGAKPNLAYTVAFDAPGYGGTRQMARMLAGSMARTYFGGDFLVFRNSPQPLFLVQREGIEEVFVETAGMEGEALMAYAIKPASHCTGCAERPSIHSA